MAKKCYIGESKVAKNVKSVYIGVDGIARKVIKAYIGVDGIAKQWWEINGIGGDDFVDLSPYYGVTLDIPTKHHSSWGSFIYQSNISSYNMPDMTYENEVGHEGSPHEQIVYAFFIFIPYDCKIASITPLASSRISGGLNEFYVMPENFFHAMDKWLFIDENNGEIDTTKSPDDFPSGRYNWPPTYIDCTNSSQVYGTTLKKGDVLLAWNPYFFDYFVVTTDGNVTQETIDKQNNLINTDYQIIFTPTSVTSLFRKNYKYFNYSNSIGLSFSNKDSSTIQLSYTLTSTSSIDSFVVNSFTINNTTYSSINFTNQAFTLLYDQKNNLNTVQYFDKTDINASMQKMTSEDNKAYLSSFITLLENLEAAWEIVKNNNIESFTVYGVFKNTIVTYNYSSNSGGGRG